MLLHVKHTFLYDNYTIIFLGSITQLLYFAGYVLFSTLYNIPMNNTDKLFPFYALWNLASIYEVIGEYLGLYCLLLGKFGFNG